MLLLSSPLGRGEREMGGPPSHRVQTSARPAAFCHAPARSAIPSPRGTSPAGRARALLTRCPCTGHERASLGINNNALRQFWAEARAPCYGGKQKNPCCLLPGRHPSWSQIRRFDPECTSQTFQQQQQSLATEDDRLALLSRGCKDG